jgi:hypothetical protein
MAAMSNVWFLRIVSLSVCLALCGCAGGALPGSEGAAPPAAAAASSTPSPPAPAAAGSGGARGGGATAAARGEPVEPAADPLMQARADCWMKVESQKALRGIDQRVTFVDKCVADQMKGKP